MKAFENHQRREGESVSHGTAKEILAGLAVLFLSPSINRRNSIDLVGCCS